MKRLEAALQLINCINKTAAIEVIHETQIILLVDVVVGVNFLSDECQMSVNFIFEEDNSIALQVYDQLWSIEDPRSSHAYYDRILLEQGIQLAQAAFTRVLRRTIRQHEEEA